MWTDATNVLSQKDALRYAWGRRAEGSRTDPAAAAIVLRDPDGIYSGRNPRSPYYGQLGRNTPVRISHGGASVALVIPPDVQGRATTTDTAALDITGDIDVRADLTPSQWGGITELGAWEVMGKYGGISQVSWGLFVLDDGQVSLRWSADGIAVLSRSSTLPVPFAPGQRGAIRATLDVNNGAAGHTVVFYTSDTLSGTWTQLGDPVVTAGTTSIFNSTASLEVGDISALGFADISREIHAIEVRNGIAGSAVANPNFAAQASGTTSFADAAGRTWSLAGGVQITSRRTRAVLEASSWVPRWGASGVDVTTPVTAAGVLRRLGRGAKPLASALRRRLPTGDPIAYWPLEDGRDATQGASPIAGCPPLRVAGFSFGQDASCPGSAALPTVSAGATMQARVPSATTSSGWTISMVYQLDTAPAVVAAAGFLAFTATGTAAHGIVVGFTSPNVIVDFYDPLGNLLTSTSFSNAGLIGPDRWIRMDFTAEYIGPHTNFTAVFVATDGSQQALSTTALAGTPGIVEDVASVIGVGLSDMAIGHLTVFDTPAVSIWDGSESGYDSETAGARLVRLGDEEGVPVAVADSVGTDTAMGPQRPATLLDLVGACEAADGGILYEDRERAGLVYRTRSTLCNQTPRVTIPYAQLAPPLEPTDDDKLIRNDRTVSRDRGSSARAVLTTGALSTALPPDGVGVYDDSQTLTVHSDDQLPDIASWLLHLGTWDEARYPKVRIYLHKYPALIPAVCSLRPGDVIRITGLPDWLPPGPLDLMVEGAEEEWKTFEWTIDLSCSPAGMWSVGVLDDATLGRLDTDGSQLASGVTSTATSLSVTTTAGQIWTTDSADRPFDIRVGGEVMTVTNVVGASSPQTFTVTRSVNGIVKAHSSGASVALATPTILAL
ncbi:hypothetical protein [Streptomyces sp. R33]|uniref:Tip attachment protein J domain-containing protein n=1 Tax=Streptomyces sp. R33 TaxID=3238629 RepID=A0AB39Y8E3_9ACTN